MKTSKLLTVLLVSLGTAGSVYAQEEGTSRGYLSGVRQNYFNGFAPFIGLGAGYTAYTNELDVEGMPSQATVLGSWTSPRLGFAFDAGVGFRNHNFSQSAALDRNVQSTLFEAAARYQSANGWQVGPVFNTFFNEGDNFGANQADVQFIGLQGLKEFDISNDWLMRAGGRYMTDVNVNGTWLNMAMIDVQFGYKPTGARMSAPATTENIYRDSMEDDDFDASSSRAVATDANEIEGSAGNMGFADSDAAVVKDALLFDLESSDLNSNSQDTLEKLAAALEDHPNVVGKIEVVGYADPTGTEEFNMQLSRERARAVKDKLVAEGYGDDQIQIVGLGEDRSPTSDYAKSRRVEIRFKDVKDKDRLQEIISEIE